MKRGPSTETSAPKRQAIEADTFKRQAIEANALLTNSFLSADIEGVKKALRAGANPNGYIRHPIPYLRSIPYLHYAVKMSDVEFTKALIDAGADLNMYEYNGKVGNTAVLVAILEDNHEALALLLSKGATVDIIMGGDTPLLHAVKGNNLKAAELLLQHGANMLFRCYGEKSPRDCALRLKNEEMIALFDSQKLSLDLDHSSQILNLDLILSSDRQPSKDMAFPKNMNSKYATNYAVGILSNLKFSNGSPNPILNKIYSYLPGYGEFLVNKAQLFFAESNLLLAPKIEEASQPLLTKRKSNDVNKSKRLKLRSESDTSVEIQDDERDHKRKPESQGGSSKRLRK